MRPGFETAGCSSPPEARRGLAREMGTPTALDGAPYPRPQERSRVRSRRLTDITGRLCLRAADADVLIQCFWEPVIARSATCVPWEATHPGCVLTRESASALRRQGHQELSGAGPQARRTQRDS